MPTCAPWSNEYGAGVGSDLHKALTELQRRRDAEADAGAAPGPGRGRYSSPI